MNQADIQQAALRLRTAADTGKYIIPLRETWTDITLDNAYAIQHENTQWQISQGRRVIGRKIGLTSVAVQRQLGVDQPDFGTLLDDMCFGDGEAVPLQMLAQPKVEAEVAFVLGRDIQHEKPGLVDVLNAVEYALPAIEIVGSRIAHWNIRIADTVADNASSSAFLLRSQSVVIA